MLGLFLLALVVAGLFGVRAIQRATYWRTHLDVPIRAWMTVPYVAHSYHVPAPLLYDALGVKPVPPPDRRPLRQIAREQNRNVEELINDLQDAIARERAAHPHPPPPREKPSERGTSP